MPEGQPSHTPTAPALKRPAKQGMQLGIPAYENFPAVQLMHGVDPVAEYWPGAHSEHTWLSMAEHEGWVALGAMAPQHENWPAGTPVQLVVKRSAG